MSGLILPEYTLREIARKRAQDYLAQQLENYKNMPLGRGDTSVYDAAMVRLDAPQIVDPTGVAPPPPSPPADDA